MASGVRLPVAVLLGFATAACGMPPAETEAPQSQTSATPTSDAAVVMTVSFDTVTLASLPRQIQAYGSVEPWQEVSISTELSTKSKACWSKRAIW